MKLRMLFVSPEFPWPPVGGGSLRTRSLLRCLGAHFDIHCVTFAQVAPSQKDMEALHCYAAQITVLPLRFHRRTTLQRYARNIGRALRFVSPLVDRFSEPDVRRALRALLEERVDWVWLEHLWLAPYVPSVRHSATKVMDVHNVESDFYRQFRKASRDLLHRLGYFVFEQAAGRIERQYLRFFDRILAVSEEDRQLLARHCPSEKIFVVPNAVNVLPLPTEEDTTGQILYFAGRLDYPPNRDAVLWFYRWVWPVIRSRLPEARWWIVGAYPELLGKEVLQDSHIVLAGQVEKTEPYLRPSSVAIVPLRVGGGTRFKILEAWAAGKSVISTAKGAEGLAAHHGENIWIADGPEEFSGAVLRLLSDASLRARLGRKGWETVQEHYSSECLRERVEAILLAGSRAS